MNSEDFMNENPGSWTDAQRKLLFKLFADDNIKDREYYHGDFLRDTFNRIQFSGGVLIEF